MSAVAGFPLISALLYDMEVYPSHLRGCDDRHIAIIVQENWRDETLRANGINFDRQDGATLLFGLERMLSRDVPFDALTWDEELTVQGMQWLKQIGRKSETAKAAIAALIQCRAKPPREFSD